MATAGDLISGIEVEEIDIKNSYPSKHHSDVELGWVKSLKKRTISKDYPLTLIKEIKLLSVNRVKNKHKLKKKAKLKRYLNKFYKHPITYARVIKSRSNS